MKLTLLLTATIFCFSNHAHAQAGRLDMSFGNNGIAKTSLGTPYSYSVPPPKQILLQPDGSMYVVQRSLTKRHADGSVDSTFGLEVNGFLADPGFEINRAALQPDGKIVVVGTLQTNVDPVTALSDFAVARYKPNGSLDSSFSGDGIQITDFGSVVDGDGVPKSGDEAFSVAIQNDGKIVVGGASGYSHISVTRYNTDGSPDSTFDDDGKLVTNFFRNSGYPALVASQADGKILLAGSFSDIVKLNNDGSTDKIFSTAGSNPFTSVNFIAIQNDGKTVAEGYTSDGWVLARYNVDGSFDKSFSGDGRQAIDFGSSLALQNDGKIVAGDIAYDSSHYRLAVARYNSDGSLDESFSNYGKQAIDFGSSSFNPVVATQSDGKIVAGSGISSYYLGLARLNSDGNLDSTFGEAGKLTDAFHAGNATYFKEAVQVDGKIIALGNAWNGDEFDKVVTRYNTDGSLDQGFGKSGVLITGISSQYQKDYTSSLAVEGDGKILIGNDHYIVRYNADGSPDSTFSENGKVTTDIYVGSLALQGDGKVVVAGSVGIGDDSYLAIARYNSDGNPDKSFTNGVQKATFYDVNPGTFRSIAIQKDGKIVAAFISATSDEYDNYVNLVRFNTNGSVDSTFGYSGIAGVGAGTSCAVVIQNDGKIVAAGNAAPHHNGRTFVSRLNIDGSIDSSFNAGDSYEFDKETETTSMAIQSDGKIVVLGVDFLRLNTNGSLDTTFNSKAAKQVDFPILDIAISSNILYAAGGGITGEVGRYLLDSSKSNTSPVVSLTALTNKATYLAPANIPLSATASDADGTISKVEFYNGNKLLHTETVNPYGFVWRNVPLGNYTITAKAYDNSGNVTTSAPVHISVVPNQPPTVSIIKPVIKQTVAAPGYIHFEAAASDSDGRITHVDFYNGSTLLNIQYQYPYTFVWKDVPAGTYTITAVATDNWGAHTTSAPVTVRVVLPIVSNRPSSENDKAGMDKVVNLKLSPNPARNILSVYTNGLQQNKSLSLSVISNSGAVLKKIQSNSSTKIFQLDVSSLVNGVYIVKLTSGDKTLYKQFVKL